jgi:hypothetical protein
MDVSEAPEVHGANTYQLSNTSLKRLTGKLNYNIEDEREFDNGSRDIVYEVGVLDFTFKYDYIKKGKITFLLAQEWGIKMVCFTIFR